MNPGEQIRICVPVCERTVSELESAAARAAQNGDLIELRLDCLDPSELENSRQRLSHLIRELDQPVIVTLRAAEEGGRREMDRKTRHCFWSEGEYPSADFLDIELDLIEEFCSSQNAPSAPLNWDQIICSRHYFDGVPDDLEETYARMASTPARFLKLAVQPVDVSDCLPIFRLLERAQREGRDTIAIAMGAAGIATRILGPSRGSFLTYGSLDDESTTAPGQITARELRELYRINEINRQTQITGLVGLPIAHSVSPHMHNAAFFANRIDAVYIPFEVRDPGEFLERMVRPATREIDWPMRGLSVTAPHKRAVMSHLDWIEPAAKEIGAVNTIIVEDGTLHGHNTDATAVLQPIVERGVVLREIRCAVIGAGGVASAALWSLKKEGASVTVFARDTEKGSALAHRFGAACERLSEAHFHAFDLVINATPLGTRGPLEAGTPATADQLRGARLIYDLVYNPVETRFVSEARNAGCETISGLPMLVAQAAQQFKLWTGSEAPVGTMRKAARRALDKRSEFGDLGSGDQTEISRV